MAVFGIDISKYQANMDLGNAKDEGVRFAIIRAMYGNRKDSAFESNYQKAKAQGLGVGAYWWTRAVNEAQAKEEAEILVSTCLKGKEFDYPIYIDVEDALLEDLGKDKVDKIITSALETLESYGYYAGFYMNQNWYNNYCHGERLAKRFTSWIAKWINDYPGSDMWQFGGETNPIRTNIVAGMVCDQDYCYKDFPTIIKNGGFNGYGKNTSIKPPVHVYTYIVQSGDTLSAIANRFGTTYQHLAQINGISNPNKIYPGQILKIYNTGNTKPKDRVYIVQKGDTLSGIAKKFNTTYQKIAKDNNISDPNKIYPGEKLVIR